MTRQFIKEVRDDPVRAAIAFSAAGFLMALFYTTGLWDAWVNAGVRRGVEFSYGESLLMGALLMPYIGITVVIILIPLFGGRDDDD